MATNTANVIVTDSLCACRAIHMRRVHHHSFPEVHVEGLTTGEAARGLVDRLGGLLDTVSSDSDRHLIEEAIDDVRTYVERHPPGDEASPAGAPTATAELGPSRVFDIRPLGSALGKSRSVPLVQTENLEVTRMVLPHDCEIPSHESSGEATVQCLEGLVDFHVAGRTQRLIPGQLVHLNKGEPHAIVALEDSSLLLTLVRS